MSIAKTFTSNYKPWQIMKKCGEVAVDQADIEAYTNPEVVPYSEIRRSPKKRRVSVSGVVREVSLNIS